MMTKETHSFVWRKNPPEDEEEKEKEEDPLDAMGDRETCIDIPRTDNCTSLLDRPPIDKKVKVSTAIYN
ncbi:hypothetical protein GWI33_013490 [Rhynchophorus ferrugineus]|uniref:Uncharacterized protein n=1 Tax=Rhynchophorus ferrugineus TaxID=354439 RepID=A0A834M6L0_RHYFE|nr:hypothetical protein GWI33_013490 [Rhynchophorus ferrugineus]